MTIEVFGHVQSLEQGPRDQVAVLIQVESSRMCGECGNAPTIRIIASHAEVDSYRPGMEIKILIQPHIYTDKHERAMVTLRKRLREDGAPSSQSGEDCGG